jgi:tetratricopeptide (TPR) repeat protein
VRARSGSVGPIWLFAALSTVAPAVFAEEDFATRFAKAAEAGPPTRAEQILAEWGKKEPNNPDYYIKGANYFFKQARDGISISTKPAARGDMVITDPKTGKAVGSIGAANDGQQFDKAVDLLKAAKTRFPQRLDIWLGLSQLYQADNRFTEQATVLKDLAAYVNAHPTGLLGRDGHPFPEPVREKLAREYSGFAGYCYKLETKEADQQFFVIATLAAEAFPDTVYGFNLLGNYYSVVDRNPSQAIENYRKALALAPADSLVWCNLGETYRQAEKYADAREAFGKVLELNNDAASVEQAKSLLEKLPP